MSTTTSNLLSKGNFADKCILRQFVRVHFSSRLSDARYVAAKMGVFVCLRVGAANVVVRRA